MHSCLVCSAINNSAILDHLHVNSLSRENLHFICQNCGSLLEQPICKIKQAKVRRVLCLEHIAKIIVACAH